MMKAVSIKQPWASLVCTPRQDNPLLGIKDIENRMWRTHFRGRIFVHASGKPDKEPYKIFTNEQASLFIDSDLDLKMLQSYKETSRIIGEVDIIDCVLNYESIWAEKTVILGETIDNKTLYDEGPIWNWVLANPVLYEKPILNIKGKLSFWEPTPNQTCMSCEEKFFGQDPQYCCNGSMCGCMGQPIEPVVCSEECYDKLVIENHKRFL